MNRFLNYISIAFIALTLFSCADKNTWNSSTEEEYKKNAKEGMLKSGNGTISKDQVDYVIDCAVEKFKSKNIKPYDVEKPENKSVLFETLEECTIEWVSKNQNQNADNNWNSKSEETYKTILKNTFTKSGVSDKDATFLVDCAITKMKAQNVSPADLQNPKNGDLVQKIGKSCGEELMKKK
ncbi:hypothetical protein [Flavobacterium sp. 3-210]